jgi:hypothetical protein
MDARDTLRNAQHTPKTVQDYAQAAAEEMEYRQSEAYQREQWEKEQDRWEAKAKREGWSYTRKPFIGALERQKQAELAKQREIAELKEKLAKLEGV